MGWKTHTEGGSWSGGGTDVPNCNATERTTITTAFNYLSSTGQPCVAGIGGLTSLANCLNGKTISSVEIDCSCTGLYGTAPLGGDSINVCDLALPPTGNQVDCDVTVFHELIHSCDGGELDAWSLENHCYSGHGTFSPGSSTVSGFLSETSNVGGGLRAGKFVVWEPSTGGVWVKVETGGSWNSSPTISKGASINVNTSAYTI